MERVTCLGGYGGSSEDERKKMGGRRCEEEEGIVSFSFFIFRFSSSFWTSDVCELKQRDVRGVLELLSFFFISVGGRVLEC